MATPHPLQLDPDEALWFFLSWNSVLEADENIDSNASAWTPGAEAVLDNQTTSANETGARQTGIKITGGLPAKVYPWTDTIQTTDGAGRTRTRQRTILITTVAK